LRDARIAIGRIGAADPRRVAAGVTARDDRGRSRGSPTAQRAGFKSAVHNSTALRGADDHVIEHRIGGVANVVIVVTEKSQRVAVTGSQVRGDLHPSVIGRTDIRQNRRRSAGGVIAQRRSRPIVSHCVGTSHLVPERELTAGCRRGKRLRNSRIAVGRTCATDARRISAAVAAGDN